MILNFDKGGTQSLSEQRVVRGGGRGQEYKVPDALGGELLEGNVKYTRGDTLVIFQMEHIVSCKVFDLPSPFRETDEPILSVYSSNELPRYCNYE